MQLSAQPLNNHLQFDGVDDYISLNNMDIAGSNITLEALINSSDLSNCQYRDCRIISKATGLTTPDHYWMLSTNNSGTNTVLRFRLKTNGTSTTLVATTGPLSENTWYHVAATYNGSTMKLFLNGTEVGSTAKTGALTTNAAAEAYIGGNPPGNDRPWKGEIDEVRIWNTARTQAQLQANRNSELTGNEAGLQAYYKFNEGSGQTINDQTGNNNTVLGSTNSVDNNDPTFAINNPTMAIDIKVLLEGSYDPNLNEMTNSLETQNLIPNNQPFNQTTWNYYGIETKSISQVSDWVLVSFRTEVDGNSEIARAAGELQLDGQVHFQSQNILPTNLNTPVYIVIETRNHLTVMSPQPVAMVNGVLTYNFSMADSYSSSGRGQKQVANGKWVMFSGDINHDLDINGADRVLWAVANGSFGSYVYEDLNLNGDVNGDDRIYWAGNNGVFSTVPKSDTARTVPVLSCSPLNFVLSSCNYTVNWVHQNPLSTTVNYDLRINGIDPSPSVTYPTTSNTVDICNILGISSGTGSFDVELFYWYDGDVSNQISAGICTVNYDFGTSNSGNWGVAQSDDDYDESLPYSGIFVGAANPGFYGAANTSYARHQTIRFRAEKTGAIDAVIVQNRILTGTTVHRRSLLNSSAGAKYKACLDEFAARGNPILNQNNPTQNKKANKCGYMIGGSYSSGNGGAQIFQIRNDVNGEPDMANPPLAQTAVPFIPVDHQNGGWVTHVLSSSANVTAGVFYHITVYNTTPVVGAYSNLPASQAYNMPDNTGAFSINGIQYAVSPNFADQEGPFYTGHYTMKSTAMDASTWERDLNTYGWYGVRYTSGEWSGLTAAAFDVWVEGKQTIEGNRHARQVLTATHNTTVDGVWVQHGHVTTANGQPMTLELKLGSNTLGTASIPHNATVKTIVQSPSNAWERGASVWSYASLDNEVNLIQGNTYYIEASAPSGAGFRLNNMANTYAYVFPIPMQNIPLNTDAQRSEDGGSTWTVFPIPGSAFHQNRHLQMVLTVKGMPRTLTE